MAYKQNFSIVKRSTLQNAYHQFMRKRITQKYLSDFDNLLVLGENFIDNYYFIIFETHKDKYKVYIIVENIDMPVFQELKVILNGDKYAVVDKSNFSKILPLKIRKKLAKRGLCSTVDIGLKTNKYFCLHRLIACLYFNCLNLQVHHINKNISDNHISNLVPLTTDFHKVVDNDLRNGEAFAKNTQFQLLNKCKKFNLTVANNENILKEIIELKNASISIKEIINKLKRFIKKSKVYEICNFFYYSKEFIKWLELQSNCEFSQFYGKCHNFWFKTLQFEKLII